MTYASSTLHTKEKRVIIRGVSFREFIHPYLSLFKDHSVYDPLGSQISTCQNKKLSQNAPLDAPTPKNLMPLFHDKKSGESRPTTYQDMKITNKNFSRKTRKLPKQIPLETLAKKLLISSRLAVMDPPGDIMVPTTPLKKSLIPISIGRLFTEMPMTWSHGVTLVNFKAKSRKNMKCPKMQFKYARYLTYGASISWGHSRLLEEISTFSWPLTTCLNGLKQKRSPQTSGKVEVSNRGLKRILERTVGENRASWSDKLDNALWAFLIAFKTPIGCTPYKLVYGKACHLPIELEHKAHWALKHCNFDLKTAGDHRKVKMNELNELWDQAYENSLIYIEKTKKIHDSKIKNGVFNVGDRVLLFNSRLNIFSGKLKTR
ncbi:reverse transcriptase domain-containing protein [Tanacetum coccineum]